MAWQQAANDNIGFIETYEEDMICYVDQPIVCLVEVITSNSLLGCLDSWTILNYKSIESSEPKDQG